MNYIGRNAPYRVFVPFLLWIVRLPATGRKDVLVFLVPASQNHFTCMRLEEKSYVSYVITK